MLSAADQIRALWADEDRRKKMPQNRYLISIGGVDYTKYVPMPVKWSSLLDERLDEGRISMRHVPVALFPPMTPVVIRLSDTTESAEKLEYKHQRVFLISVDDSTEAPVGSGYYSHEISLVEETKELEGIIIEPITYTNDLGRVYTGDPKKAVPSTVWPYDECFIKSVNQKYDTPTPNKKTLIISSLKDVVIPFDAEAKVGYEFYYDQSETKVTVIPPAGDPISIVNGITTEASVSKAGSVYINQVGVWQVHYQSSIRQYSRTGLGTLDARKLDITFQLISVTNYAPLPRWNVASVIDRLLDLAIPHLENESPKYKLHDAQREELSKIEAPEFAFSK